MLGGLYRKEKKKRESVRDVIILFNSRIQSMRWVNRNKGWERDGTGIWAPLVKCRIRMLLCKRISVMSVGKLYFTDE